MAVAVVDKTGVMKCPVGHPIARFLEFVVEGGELLYEWNWIGNGWLESQDGHSAKRSHSQVLKDEARMAEILRGNRKVIRKITDPGTGKRITRIPGDPRASLRLGPVVRATCPYHHGPCQVKIDAPRLARELARKHRIGEGGQLTSWRAYDAADHARWVKLQERHEECEKLAYLLERVAWFWADGTLEAQLIKLARRLAATSSSSGEDFDWWQGKLSPLLDLETAIMDPSIDVPWPTSPGICYKFGRDDGLVVEAWPRYPESD